MVSAWARRGGWLRPHNQHVQRDTSSLGEGRPSLRLLDGRDQRAEDLLGGRWQRGLALLCHLPSAWRRGGCDEWGAPLWGSLGGGGAGTCEARHARTEVLERAAGSLGASVTRRECSEELLSAPGSPLGSWIPFCGIQLPFWGIQVPPPFFFEGSWLPLEGIQEGSWIPKVGSSSQEGIQEGSQLPTRGSWIPKRGSRRGAGSPPGSPLGNWIPVGTGSHFSSPFAVEAPPCACTCCAGFISVDA